MNVLSLCSGAGGLELGLHLAVPAATVLAYCERDACAIEVLAARMEDGSLAPAPVFFSLGEIPGRGVLAGQVDLVAAGFPCQPHSVAGKRAGVADERWLWGDIWRIVRDVRAPLLFVENVPGLLTSGGFDRVLADLAEGGWAAEWDCVPAAAVGAPHLRDRVFLLAADPDRARLGDVRGGRPKDRTLTDVLVRGKATDAQRARLAEWGVEHDRDELAPAERGRDGWAGRSPPEPTIRRVDDGLTRQLDRDRLFVLGNAVVPRAAARAWRTLWGRLMAA